MVGTFNFSAKYLSKKDSSRMLPELTEFVTATRMGIARKVLFRHKDIFLFRQNNRRSNYNTIGNNTADIYSSKNLTIYILNDFNDILILMWGRN
jgi:hypothetical protein